MFRNHRRSRSRCGLALLGRAFMQTCGTHELTLMLLNSATRPGCNSFHPTREDRLPIADWRPGTEPVRQRLGLLAAALVRVKDKKTHGRSRALLSTPPNLLSDGRLQYPDFPAIFG